MIKLQVLMAQVLIIHTPHKTLERNYLNKYATNAHCGAHHTGTCLPAPNGAHELGQLGTGLSWAGNILSQWRMSSIFFIKNQRHP